jgi:DNA-binding MarR family transcriptional regulator
MPSLSRILVDLVARKLIEKRDGLDRRFRTLRITSGGAALVDRLASLSESEYHEIEAAVGKEKYREIMSNLDALIRRLS